MKKLLIILALVLITSACIPGITSSTSTSTIATSSPSIVAFTANPSSITAGQSTTLMWNVTNATSVQIDQGVGSGLAIAGTISISPAATTIYTLKASNSAGTVQSSVTVSVSPPSSSYSSPPIINPPPAAPALPPNIIVFDISPNTINVPPGPGAHSADMRWEVRNAATVTINGSPVPLSGSQVLTPPIGTHTYILKAFNPGGTDTRTQILHVNP